MSNTVSSFARLTCLVRFGEIPVLHTVFVDSHTVICVDVTDFIYEGSRNVSVGFSQNGVVFSLAEEEYHFNGIALPSPSPIPSSSFQFERSPGPSPTTPSPPPTYSVVASQPHSPGFMWAALAVGILIVCVLLVGVGIICFQNKRLISEALRPTVPQRDLYDMVLNGDLNEGTDPNFIPYSEIKGMKQIEKGSFGVIYSAKWRGTKIAVKMLPSAMTEKLMNEFRQEAGLMRSLRHPNILQYLGISQTGREVCICMEYMSNGSLYRMLHQPDSSFSRRRIKSICLDTVRGMNYLHKQSPPIVHRDLKSHNLLIDSHWRVKVCDFGLSRITAHNQTMTACGTPSWTAPEVLRNERYTTKADVYGFGVVVWEMFARADPFPGQYSLPILPL